MPGHQGYTCLWEGIDISSYQNLTPRNVSMLTCGYVVRRSRNIDTPSDEPPGRQVSFFTTRVLATPTLTSLYLRWDHVLSNNDYPPLVVEDLETRLGSLPNVNEYFITIRQHPDFIGSEFPTKRIPVPPFSLRKLSVQWWFSIRPPSYHVADFNNGSELSGP